MRWTDGGCNNVVVMAIVNRPLILFLFYFLTGVGNDTIQYKGNSRKDVNKCEGTRESSARLLVKTRKEGGKDEEGNPLQCSESLSSRWGSLSCEEC